MTRLMAIAVFLLAAPVAFAQEVSLEDLSWKHVMSVALPGGYSSTVPNPLSVSTLTAGDLVRIVVPDSCYGLAISNLSLVSTDPAGVRRWETADLVAEQVDPWRAERRIYYRYRSQAPVVTAAIGLDATVSNVYGCTVSFFVALEGERPDPQPEGPPVYSECVEAQDQLWWEYNEYLSSVSIRRGGEGCSLHLGFNDVEGEAAYVEHRRSLGLSADAVRIDAATGRAVTIPVTRAIQ